MKILFRCDSSSQIGHGHVMRDLVLAAQFKDDDITFACLELEGHIMGKIPYSIRVLNSLDMDELINIIQNNHIDMIIIDHYGIDYHDEKYIKERTGVKVFVLDDTYEKHHCDILLNHNIYADVKKYQGLVPAHCELRCGKNYTLIRNEFKKQKRVKSVFIAMGGADSANLNIQILEVLQDFEDIEAVVLTTSANKNLAALKKYVEDKKNIALYVDSQEVALLMKRSDFAIVTPSVTLNEIFYMELPFVAIKVADNQDEMVDYLLKNRYPVLQSFCADILHNIIEKLFIELIDFVDLPQDDKKMVLEWRNDGNIRKWMKTKEKIGLDAHLNFIDVLRKQEDKKYFLVKQRGEAIGVIDFTNINQISTEFGLYAKPHLKGVGKVLMNLIIDYAFHTLKVKTLVAHVFEENKSALKLYQAYGFKEINLQDMMRMELLYENR